MLSRVANSLYWMSRYLERVDNIARFIKVNMHLMLDYDLKQNQCQWIPLVYASGDQKDYLSRYLTFDKENVLYFLTFDRKNINSIISCSEIARENARSVREHIPTEMWEKINELYHLNKKYYLKGKLNDLHYLYSKILEIGHIITGFSANIMEQHEAWHFMNIGKMLERSDKTARFLDIKNFSYYKEKEETTLNLDSIEWASVLTSLSALEMYRKKHHNLNSKNIANFFILDQTIPRSLSFCMTIASNSLNAILNLGNQKTNAKKEMQAIQNSILNININKILNNGLHEFIDDFQFNLNTLDESIHLEFFSFE